MGSIDISNIANIDPWTTTPEYSGLWPPDRRQILQDLQAGELTAGEIGSRFTISGPSISRHLGVLKNAGLILERRDANRIDYSLVEERLAVCVGQFLSAVCPEQIVLRQRRKQGLHLFDQGQRSLDMLDQHGRMHDPETLARELSDRRRDGPAATPQLRFVLSWSQGGQLEECASSVWETFGRITAHPGVGIRTENVAHRFAVEWDGDDCTQVGVFIPRRDTNSRITARRRPVVSWHASTGSFRGR